MDRAVNDSLPDSNDSNDLIGIDGKGKPIDNNLS